MNNETPWYLKKSPLGNAYQHFSNVAKQKTVLDAKTKELIRLAIASVFRCNHCTEHHIKDALDCWGHKRGNFRSFASCVVAGSRDSTQLE